MLKNITTTTTIPTSQPFSVSVAYGHQRRLYSIPTDLTIEALILSLKRIFQIQDTFGIYLYLKKTRRLLNGFVRLSELASQSSLLTEIKKGFNQQKQGKWNQMLKSHQFEQKDIIICKVFIELTMAAIQFSG